jgi:type I restriction enzyme S subunit
VEKLKFVAYVQASNVDKHSHDDEIPTRLCNYSDVYNNGRITADLPFMEATASANEIEKFSLRAGDVIITKDSESWDDIAVPAYVPQDIDGVLCGYHLSQIRPQLNELDGAYLYHLLSCQRMNRQFQVSANGVTRFGLPSYSIENAAILLPPLDEQRAIVRFLDAKTVQIGELIAKKERLLHLLAEKRTAVVTRAVTLGLDRDSPTKKTGSAWLSEIPAHWKLMRLDALNDSFRPIMYGIVLPGPDVDDGVPIIKGGDVRPERLRLANLSKTTFEIDAQHSRSRVIGGDILYAIRGSFGDVAVVPDELSGANITQDAARISSVPGVWRPWLVFALQSEAVRQQLAAKSLGATIKGVNIRDLKRALLPVPPFQEQQDIAAHLQNAERQVARLAGAVTRHISLLSELRSTTTSNAVTGQIDVRYAELKEAAQ